MKVLIDTNVLIDYLAKREPYYENAREIIKLCSIDAVSACIAAHSVVNAFYILRKEYSVEERKFMLLQLSKIVTIIGISEDNILNCLEREDIADLEDCLQDECALLFDAEYIITRDINDFINSKVKSVLPSDFLNIIKSE